MSLGWLKFAKGFTNHEQTDPSGLIYMQARFYVPWAARFGSPDPARDQHYELTQSWNIYSYVQNRPTMSIDPTGMLTLEDAKGVRQQEAMNIEGEQQRNAQTGYTLLKTEVNEGYSSQNARNVVEVIQTYKINVASEPSIAVLRYQVWINPEGTKIEDVNGTKWSSNNIKPPKINGLAPGELPNAMDPRAASYITNTLMPSIQAKYEASRQQNLQGQPASTLQGNLGLIDKVAKVSGNPASKAAGQLPYVGTAKSILDKTLSLINFADPYHFHQTQEFKGDH